MHLKRLALAGVALLFLPIMPSQAQSARTPIDVDALGPQVGDRIPDFHLADQNGVERTLADILGPRGALILFHRSADW